MIKYLSYDIRTAQESGETNHPQQVIKDLGITYQHATPQSITDSWDFWNCENIPNPLPKYLDIIEADPMEYVGYGLRKDEAEKIRDYLG